MLVPNWNKNLCLDGTLPWTMARWADFPDQRGPVSFKLSTFRVRARKGRVKGTLVLLERGLRAYPLSHIRVLKSCRPIK
jgi:hypothetical protein